MNRIFSCLIVAIAAFGFSFTMNAQGDYLNSVWVLCRIGILGR